jgi:hypothetical protein
MEESATAAWPAISLQAHAASLEFASGDPPHCCPVNSVMRLDLKREKRRLTSLQRLGELHAGETRGLCTPPFFQLFLFVLILPHQ